MRCGHGEKRGQGELVDFQGSEKSKSIGSLKDE